MKCSNNNNHRRNNLHRQCHLSNNPAPSSRFRNSHRGRNSLQRLTLRRRSRRSSVLRSRLPATYNRRYDHRVRVIRSALSRLPPLRCPNNNRALLLNLLPNNSRNKQLLLSSYNNFLPWAHLLLVLLLPPRPALFQVLEWYLSCDLHNHR